MSFTVGLTGGIASGKSLVGAFFAELGVPVIDADQVSRDIVQPGAAGLNALVAHFGADILDETGQMDRRRMRERVFANPAARLELEAILHPLIRQRLLELRDEAIERHYYCVLMIPLLVKFGWTDLVDRLLVVDCSEETQRQRLMARDEIDTELANNMLKSQDSRNARLQAADDIILNEGEPDALRAPVQKLHAFYRQYACGDIPELPQQKL